MRVRRRRVQDVYVDSGRAAVMVDERVIVLSAVATSILMAVPVEGSAGLSEIVAAVVNEHGEPEPPLEAGTVVRQQILDLAAHDVLLIDGVGPRASAPTALPEEALHAVRGALRAVLTPTVSTRWRLPPGVTQEDFFSTVERQRVGSQLATRLDGLELPESLAASLRAHHAELTAASEGPTRDLHQVLAILADADVRVLVFKGMALAAQAWGDPRARGFGDVDLLVPPSNLARASEALGESGWRTDYLYPTPGPSWGWRHFVRTEYEMAFARGRTGVDLHWHALPARGALPEFDELWARRSEVVIAGRHVPTFGPYDALAHSASHSAKDRWRWLRGIADVHRLMSDPETWHQADRPLRGDQLLTVGIAALLFGVPDGAPQVVRDAAVRCHRVMPHVQRAQLAPERSSPTDWAPGLGTLQMLLPLWHSRAHPREFARRLSTSAMPPWALAREKSPHGYVAAPRALWHRSAEVGMRLRDR